MVGQKENHNVQEWSILCWSEHIMIFFGHLERKWINDVVTKATAMAIDVWSLIIYSLEN